MEINKLKYFKIVFENGSMRKAAEFINMSSGSLSKSIKSLEEELGVKLFLPHGRNITPTKEAKKIYNDCKTLLDQYESFMAGVKAEAQPIKTFRIGSWEVFTTYIISRFCRDEIDPSSVKLEVLERPPGVLEESVLNGEVDIGITYAPVAHPDLDFLKVTRFKFKTFATSSFAALNTKDIPFAVPISKVGNSIVSVKELDHWPKEIERNIKYRFELLETALETSRLGLSALHCPDFIVKLQNESLKKQFQLFPLELKQNAKQSYVDVYVIKRKETQEGALVKKLTKTLRKYCS